MRRAACALAAAGLTALLAPGAGQASQCRQALALALDVSGSVDAREYRLQSTGLAAALADARVRRRLLAMPEAAVRLMIYEWSGPGDHAVLLPWTEIADPVQIDHIRQQLLATERRDASPGTALGLAMGFGIAQLDRQAGCWKRTLDISGDGQSNLGPRPRDVRLLLGGNEGITINALVIGAQAPGLADRHQSEISALSAYFKAEVIHGPDAFVQAAVGYEDYAEAMALKLLRELDGLVVSEARGAGQ
ncbi:DUF1194 domain-containing protein [Sulfitobacter aestuarii]|uniref:DUF1194 domain-containing protein n=1 Tax=Sulfitobacter aestuarii TaxID=2161676 RepID=A0ABW5TZD4_9RHOB